MTLLATGMQLHLFIDHKYMYICIAVYLNVLMATDGIMRIKNDLNTLHVFNFNVYQNSAEYASVRKCYESASHTARSTCNSE